MVMGLMRASADVVIIGTGTFSADRRHVWTAAAVFPELADEYRQLSEALGQRVPPLYVIVSGSGRVDLRLPVFTSGRVPALVQQRRAFLTSPSGNHRKNAHELLDLDEGG